MSEVGGDAAIPLCLLHGRLIDAKMTEACHMAHTWAVFRLGKRNIRELGSAQVRGGQQGRRQSFDGAKQLDSWR